MFSINRLQFLKLGGSLITEKDRPATARLEVLKRLALEIKSALDKAPALRLLLGHGSGSFGHVPASRYGTRDGVRTANEWRGFLEVWHDAAALNRIVTEELSSAGIPAISFPPSTCVTAQDGMVAEWNTEPLEAALQAGLVPVVYGDVVFDNTRGGTILSTEDLFSYLVHILQPDRILLAGRESGVWADYPECTEFMDEITPVQFSSIRSGISGSSATDVTGGMFTKVQQSVRMVEKNPGLEILIFSGDRPDNVEGVLLGDRLGTLIRNE